MYFVDSNKIEKILHLIEVQTETLKAKQAWESEIEKLALERITHLLIDGVLDVGNLMIDGFIMRDPGSFEDIVDILVDEKVITVEMGMEFKTLLPYRKIVVHDYLIIDHEELRQAIYKLMPFFDQYPKDIRNYLSNELGPVSAFGKKQ